MTQKLSKWQKRLQKDLQRGYKIDYRPITSEDSESVKIQSVKSSLFSAFPYYKGNGGSLEDTMLGYISEVKDSNSFAADIAATCLKYRSMSDKQAYCIAKVLVQEVLTEKDFENFITEVKIKIGR